MTVVLDKLILARTHLLLDHPEFGSLALNLEFSDKNPTDAPMATDGTYIFYTPALIADWTDGELQWTIAHEALHCGFLHPYRMGERDLTEWNEACVTGNTAITMADGSYKLMRDVSPGDYVLSPYGPNKVLGKLYSGTKAIVELDTGTGNKLYCTGDHKIFSDEGFVRAGEFEARRAYVLRPADACVCSVELFGKKRARVGSRYGLQLQKRTRVFEASGATRRREFTQPSKSKFSAVSVVDRCAMGVSSWYCGRRRHVVNTSQKRIFSMSGSHNEHVIYTMRLAAKFGIQDHISRESSRNPILAFAYHRLPDGRTIEWDASVFSDKGAARGLYSAVHNSTPSAGIPCAADRRDVFDLLSYQNAKPTRLSVKDAGEAEVYDLITDKHVYYASNVLVHNCDYAINLLLVESGVGQPPTGVLYDTQYKNLSAEQIYSKRRVSKAKDDAHSNRMSQTTKDDQQHDTRQSLRDAHESNASQNNSDTQSSSTRPGTGADDVIPAPNTASRSERDNRHENTSRTQGDNQTVSAGQPVDDGPIGRANNTTSDAQPGRMSEFDWQIAAEQAFLVSAKAGADTANITRAIKEQTAPVSDLYEKLRSFVEAIVPTDYSWRVPNKRYLVDADLYLPGIAKDSTPPIVVAIDTSASVTQPMLDTFGALLTEVVREFKPREVHVIYADSSVKHEQVFTPDDAEAPEGLKLEAKGGGGTAFGPTFRHIEEDTESKYNEVAAIVYVTDLYGSDNATVEPPAQPVLWVTPLHVTEPEPWGTRAYVDLGRRY